MLTGMLHDRVSDTSVRYVAQINIEPATEVAPSDAMMRLAGQHFLRWDKENNVFVSNLRDEYPDD